VLPNGLVRRRRVPLVLQAATNDCAAACLAMILSAYGISSSLERCRRQCRTGRGGASGRDIVEAARRSGLRARAYACPPEVAAGLPTPMIAYLRSRHFVVVERFASGSVRLLDPAVGRRRPTMDRFAADSLGVFLTFETGAVVSQDAPVASARWWTYLRPGLAAMRGRITVILLATAVLQLAALAAPRFTAAVVDQLVAAHAAQPLTLLGLGMLAVVLTRLCFGWLRAAVLSAVQRGLDGSLTTGFVDHLFALPLNFFAQRTSADLVDRAAGTAMVRELVVGQAFTGVLEATFLTVYLAILAASDPVTAICTTVLALVQVALLARAAPRTRSLLQEHLLAQSHAHNALFEAINGIHTVKATGVEPHVVAHWSRLFDTALDAMQRRVRQAGIFEAIQASIVLFGSLLLLWIGARRVLGGALTVGQMLGLNMLAAMVLAPVTTLVATAQRLQTAAAHLVRMTDVFDARTEPRTQGARVAPITGHIELRGDRKSVV